MTDAEARQRAAVAVLELIAQARWADDPTEVVLEVNLIVAWLRRRAALGDRTLIRQLEKPLARQVRATPRQAKNLGIPEGRKP